MAGAFGLQKKGGLKFKMAQGLEKKVKSYCLGLMQ
jgi:hypothetical protein